MQDTYTGEGAEIIYDQDAYGIGFLEDWIDPLIPISSWPAGLESVDDYNELMEALSQLPDDEHRLLLLRFGFVKKLEYTQKECAKFLGISQSSVSKLEKRAMMHLKAILNPEQAAHECRLAFVRMLFSKER